jgi:hypothetical protein
MKILSRDFTLKEKILMVFLAVVLLGMLYYQFIDQPVRTALASAEAEKASIQMELDAVNLQIETLSRMSSELETLRDGEGVSAMASYNNAKAELALLNDALSITNNYSISFADVTRDGDQIRRSFALQFTAPNYATMEQVLSQLAASPYRCLIGDLSCSVSRPSDTNSEVHVGANATFYETMVDGVPDSGLPVDASEDASQPSSFDAAVIGEEAVRRTTP